MSRGRAAFDLPSFFCTYQPNKTYCVSVLYKNSDISYPKFVFDVIYVIYKYQFFYRGHRSHGSDLHVKKEVLAQGENMYTAYTATDLYRECP